MLNKKFLFFLSAGCFGLFVFFSYLVHKDFFVGLDFDATVRLQDNISQRFNDLFSFFSEIGSFEATTIALVIIFAVWRKFWVGLLGIFLFGSFHFFELFGKYFVDHPPPPQFLLRTKNLIDFPQFHVRASNSYPSGHSGRAILISIVLLVLIWQTEKLPKEIKILLTILILGFDCVMLVSRVYLGEHWTTDVVGGALLGAAIGFFIAAALAWQKKKKAVKNA